MERRVGRGQEEGRVARVFEEIGIPRDAVEVVVVEVPKENWGLGGELASERFRQVRAP